MDDLAWMDATEQARMVRDGQASPKELVEAAIERIERVNPSLNAVVLPMYDLARDRAAETSGAGPFVGVPFLLKDLGASFGGVRQTAGSRFLADHVAASDSELTARLKRAGLIVVG